MSKTDEKYAQLGGAAGFLGAPLGAEVNCADGKGRLRHYQNGSIYWNPDPKVNKAFEVHGAIRAKWQEMGAEGGTLGYPTTDERRAHDGQGRVSYFASGVIYWHPATGAHEVHGAILGRWENLGSARSLLGYPITDEVETAPGTNGRVNHFQHGSIYWKNGIGAYALHGAILAKYKGLGAETSSLGFPKTNETPDGNGGRFNRFEHGNIVWTPATGAQVK